MSIGLISRTIRRNHRRLVRYVDRESALEALRLLHGVSGGSVYRCDVCPFWHVVSPRKFGR